jgi:hypothetical protein
VSALGGILALLTFNNGFVSARLHTAYREAAREQRTIDRDLASGPDKANGTTRLPLVQLESQYEDVRNALRETLAGPVLVLVWLATVGGVILAELTRRHANLKPVDRTHPEQSWALLILALALIAVTVLTTADYFRLRARLRHLGEDSLVGDIIGSERQLFRAFRLKAEIRGRRLHAHQDTHLLVEITDDGTGIAEGTPSGVGLVSLRERAAELGGRCEIISAVAQGTTVRAWLPVGARHAAGGSDD